MVMHNVLCTIHSHYVSKHRPDVAPTTTPHGRLTHVTDMTCWFLLIQSWFPGERASPYSEPHGSMPHSRP